MSKDFNDINYEATRLVMREARWDPQTHDREDWRFVSGKITKLMNALAQGDMAKASLTLTAVCREVSAHLDGGYGWQRSDKLDPEGVREIIQSELAHHYRLPPLMLIK